MRTITLGQIAEIRKITKSVPSPQKIFCPESTGYATLARETNLPAREKVYRQADDIWAKHSEYLLCLQVKNRNVISSQNGIKSCGIM